MEYDIKYGLLQAKYRKIHNNQNNIFPNEWYNVKEYELKIAILEECLIKKCLITESKYYLKFRELALKKDRFI